jgi:hypothetical protein
MVMELPYRTPHKDMEVFKVAIQKDAEKLYWNGGLIMLLSFLLFRFYVECSEGPS